MTIFCQREISNEAMTAFLAWLGLGFGFGFGHLVIWSCGFTVQSMAFFGSCFGLGYVRFRVHFAVHVLF